MVPALSVEHLTKRFGDVVAVDNLSFSVQPGQVCGLLGPNGAGKTTTVRILLGLVHASGGEAFLLGERARSGAEVLRRTGVLVEQPAFIPHLSGLRNLEFYWRSGNEAWPPPNLETALAIAGLGRAVDRKLKTYSQGMRQRLGIAQSLLRKPELLILDEPTNGLDPGEMREVRRSLKGLAGEGITVLISSHLLAEVEQVCSHVVVMDKGRLVTRGTVADIMAASTGVYIEVDDLGRARGVIARLTGVRSVVDDPPGLSLELNGLARQELVAALVNAGVGVSTVATRNRLEEAFLGLFESESSPIE
ncbi:MAG: ABC transporter ATP-binding protein [Actinomycetota bacterium]